MPTIAIAQIDITLADRERNLARIIQVLGETAAKGAKLTVFPEAALTGYCFDTLDEASPHAEPIPGPSTQRLTGICRELGCHVVYGLLEADGDRIFNARSEEHTSELQSQSNLVCRLLLEKKKKKKQYK